MGRTLQQFAGLVTVTDGAWGTQLQAQGLPSGACPDAWNADNAPAILAVADSYLLAGAQVILTNTFRANRLALAHWGLQARAAELARRGAALSRQAAGNDAQVFGSMGPTGRIVMLGELSKDQFRSAFAEQAVALGQGGADAILCESFFELEEIMLAAEAALTATALPVVCSMTFTAGQGKVATLMGTTPGDLAAAAKAAGASAVGANCGAGPGDYVEIARRLRQATDLPIWIKPNAGLPVVRDGQTTFPMGPQEFGALVGPLVSAGANFLGGCCGTTPEHVRAIRKALAGG